MNLAADQLRRNLHSASASRHHDCASLAQGLEVRDSKSLGFTCGDKDFTAAQSRAYLNLRKTARKLDARVAGRHGLKISTQFAISDNAGAQIGSLAQQSTDCRKDAFEAFRGMQPAHVGDAIARSLFHILRLKK